MLARRWLAILIVPLAVIAAACSDDDDGESPRATETPAGATTAPPSDTPEPTVTIPPTPTPVPTPVNALTEEIIAAAGAYLETTEPAYEITEPPECPDITALIDAGDATIDEFVGENLICLIDPQFEDGRVRVGFGPYASEVIGVLVLEETDDGGWRGITIEPGPQIEV
jgi:hypothetical protein